MILRNWPALLIGVALIASPSQQTAAQKQDPVDPYARAYGAQRVERYNQARQRFLLIVNNLYFSFGCKVFPDEASITPLIMNEYQQLLRGNEDLFSDTVSTRMQENARTGLARSKTPGECDYFKQNADVVLELRTAAHRAMGF